MSTTETRKTYRQAMLDIRDHYREAGNPWPTTAHNLAEWAIAEGEWEPPAELAVNKCSRDMAKALKEEKHTDPQGRKVKTNVAARLEYRDEADEPQQGYFWDDIRTASEDHLLASFEQQRGQVVGDVKSIDLQVQSANENNPNLHGRPIKMLWDFTEEVELPRSPDPQKPR